VAAHVGMSYHVRGLSGLYGSKLKVVLGQCQGLVMSSLRMLKVQRLFLATQQTERLRRPRVTCDGRNKVQQKNSNAGDKLKNHEKISAIPQITEANRENTTLGNVLKSLRTTIFYHKNHMRGRIAQNAG
jgi:hypothetical protein